MNIRFRMAPASLRQTTSSLPRSGSMARMAGRQNLQVS